jgi:hypothetical protein
METNVYVFQSEYCLNNVVDLTVYVQRLYKLRPCPCVLIRTPKETVLHI